MNYQGDFLEDATVYITFNTFDSNDPSASVTITDLAQGDVEIWKDGVVQTTAGSGVTLTLNIGTGNGSHLIAVDTSDNTDGGFYAIGADYQVRINGTTIDGATVNAWVGTFSIENRFTEVNVTAMAAGVIANATFNADVGSTEHSTNIIALAARKILEELNLDHLLKVDTSVVADGDLENFVVAGTVLAHLMSANKDVTGFKCTTDSLEAIKVHADTIKSETVLIVEDTNAIQGKLPANKFMGSSDGADDDTTLNTIAGDVINIDGIVPAAVADLGTVQSGDSYAIVNGVAGLVAIDTVVDAIKVVTDLLADSATTLVSGTVSHDNSAATTTNFWSNDVSTAAADHYNGRIVIFLTGTLAFQATDITDYVVDAGEGKFTVTALTSAPADNVTFVIV